MKTFKYLAADELGRPVRGKVDAVDWQAAMRELNERGLRCTTLFEVTESRPLSTADAVEFSAYLSALAKAGLPLGEGLRAAASDGASPPLSSALLGLAERIEAGEPLDLAIEAMGDRLPPHVRTLMVAGARSGQLSESLEGLLAHERSIDDMTRCFWQATMYPLTLFAFLVVWLAFAAIWLQPHLEIARIFEDFGTEARLPVNMLVDALAAVPLALLVASATVALVLVVVYLRGGTALVSRLAARVPLLGKAWRYCSLVDFTGLSTVFLDRHLHLDEALVLVAASARDPAMRAASTSVAERVRAGADFSQGLATSGMFPSTLVNLVEWSSERSVPADALRTAREMYAERFSLQLRLARLVLPPIVFVLIFAAAWLVMFAIFTPLIRLITDLS